ncbi:hypothetical protein CEXT_20991 [Caerostris extrusa]|uniref:Uncharacterized protein n=1 Tax=Caerostris extrusa TaxID=172846 RepID=A0AAV4QKW2_CAEEX|nr:hypothetical protein CEXT_20991 [Caerostris extrusa]
MKIIVLSVPSTWSVVVNREATGALPDISRSSLILLKIRCYHPLHSSPFFTYGFRAQCNENESQSLSCRVLRLSKEMKSCDSRIPREA